MKAETLKLKSQALIILSLSTSKYYNGTSITEQPTRTIQSIPIAIQPNQPWESAYIGYREYIELKLQLHRTFQSKSILWIPLILQK